MNKHLETNNKVSDLCILAGRIMLESNAETYRVEDTMTRIANAYGIVSSESYVTPTAIIFTVDGNYPTKTKMIRIMNRTTDLNKIALVNSISREISTGSLTIDEAYEKLKEIEKTVFIYPVWLQILAAAICSGSFVIIFRGGWYDFLPAFFTGGISFLCFLIIDRLTKVRFFSEFTASAIIALLAILFVKTEFGVEVDKIIIGSVMPLVPGLLITNAIRDLIAGHLVSGLTKGVEALLTASAIGSGVAVIIVFF